MKLFGPFQVEGSETDFLGSKLKLWKEIQNEKI